MFPDPDVLLYHGVAQLYLLLHSLHLEGILLLFDRGRHQSPDVILSEGDFNFMFERSPGPECTS